MEENKLPSVAEIRSLTAKIQAIANAIDNEAKASGEQENAILDLGEAAAELCHHIDANF